MRLTGRVLVIVGGAVSIASLAALPYVGEVTMWKLAEIGGLASREPLVLTVIAGAAALFALASLFNDSPLASAVALAGSFLLLGETFDAGLASYNVYATGFWVASSSALVMSLGGLLMFTGYGPSRQDAVSAAGTFYSASDKGWYPDPAASGRDRYWTGTAWTEHTRPHPAPPETGPLHSSSALGRPPTVG